MVALTLDDAAFAAGRHKLLENSLLGEAGRRREMRTVASLNAGSARKGALPEVTLRALDRLAPQHASAARGHMQLFRACLESMALVPADDLVNAAVQIEALWYANPFKKHYRDHLAHVMKVAWTAQRLLDELGLFRAETLIEFVAKSLARHEIGHQELRAMARRLGVTDNELASPAWWNDVVRESVRVASLLHDLDYASMMGRKVRHAASATDPDHDWSELTDAHPPIESIVRHLIALPFTRWQLPARDLLRQDTAITDREREAVAEVYEISHSLTAGVRILQCANAADALVRLHPTEAFVFEWAALAASMHDYDKVWELRAEQKAKKNAALAAFAHTNPPTRSDDFCPLFEKDPVSWIVALADQLQDWSRMQYRREYPEATKVVLELEQPVSKVSLGRTGNKLNIVWHFCDERTHKRWGDDKRKDMTGTLGEWLRVGKAHGLELTITSEPTARA